LFRSLQSVYERWSGHINGEILAFVCHTILTPLSA
jgi:hypothetical protein